MSVETSGKTQHDGDPEVSRGRGAPNGNGKNQLDHRLKHLLDSSSRTFAYTLEMLPNPLKRWLGAAYLGARIIDEIEDSDLAFNDKKYIMGRVPVVLRGSADDEAKSLERMLEGISADKDEGYKELLGDIGFVHKALSTFPGNVQDIIRARYQEMASGLANPSLQNIETLEDHHKYCHYAAGLVGYLVTDLVKEAGYFNDDNVKKVMPNPSDWNLGVNSAHDFGVGLQLTNDIRDLLKDASEDIYRWPSQLVNEEELNYHDLVSLSKDSGVVLDKAYNILDKQLKDARSYIMSGADWVEELPFEPVGLRRSWTNALAMSAATLRKIDTKEFFYNPDVLKIGREEVGKIDAVATVLAQNRKSIKPFMSHLLENPADKYEI